MTPSLPDKILAIDRRLTEADIDHAFGGALALAYYAEPRATIDIDVNLFVAPSAYEAVAAALAPLGVATDADLRTLARDGQCRVWWERTPLDLFFAYDEIHEAMRRGVRTVPFGEDRLPILAPEHLVVCKAVFDRAKDWLDIEQVLVCVDELDLRAMRSWLARLVGEDDRRALRLRQLLSLRVA
ncbi:MAG TPA: hypothetical protein VEJ23_06165 [Solirubrobacteraceae bacterium]|nr:hypothetical protein [Solirubrobacteraceae bacterium]